MPEMYRLRDAIEARYGTTPEEALPVLLQEFRTPYLIAVALGVYANAVRNLLIRQGYRNVDGEWQKVEGTHEHA